MKLFVFMHIYDMMYVEQVLWPFKTIFRETNYFKRKWTSLKSRTSCWDFKPSDASFKSSSAFKQNLTISRQSRPFGSYGSVGQFVCYGCKNFDYRQFYNIWGFENRFDFDKVLSKYLFHFKNHKMIYQMNYKPYCEKFFGID